MRDLQKTLKLFDKAFVMDYCEEFDEVKSILEYCDKHVKPFSKLHFRGGNEPFIMEISQRLQQLFVARGFVDAESNAPNAKCYQQLRKILLFLLANTDATYKYNLRENTHVSHVLELCPLLPKFLFTAIVWELQLDRLFFELLSYAPCWVTFQFFESAVESLKHIKDPYVVLEKVEQLVCAIFLSITRSKYTELDKVDRKCIFGKLYDCAINLLRQFYTPDSEKFKQFTKSKLYRYSGFALKHILQMVLFAFDVYESPAKAEPTIDIEIYSILQPHKEAKSSAGDVVNAAEPALETLKEHQMKIISALLNSLQYNVMLVKVDVFMFWLEVDLTPTVNLQMNVGEMAYKVGERIRSNREFNHDVEPQLKMIAIRPKTLQETISEATVGEILLALDEPLEHSVKLVWFNELFSRSVTLGNDECVQTIKDHLKMVSMENCQLILEYIKLEILRAKVDESSNVDLQAMCIENEDIEVASEDFDDLMEIILLALQHFSNEQILKLLEYQLKLFGASANICCRTHNFQQRATEFLNKYAASFDLQQFLVLCFENPWQMWSKLFDGACHNSAHVENFCRTVQQTRPFSNVYFPPLIEDAMKDDEKIQQKYFPELLCSIYFTLFHPERKTEFLKQFVNKNVNALLDAQAFESLLPLVKLLNLIESRGVTQSHKPLNFGEVTAPTLLMAAQIMDRARWDLITYTNARDEIVRECIQYIQRTSKKFLPVATERDRKWITKVVKDSYRPLTQYYFQKFSMPANEPPVEFDSFLIRPENHDKSEAELFLIMNYVRCTLKETEWLARSERLLPHISDVMIVLSTVVVEANNPNALNSYRHSLTNYANIVTKFLLPQAGTDQRRIEKLILKVLKIIHSAPEPIYNEMFLNFESLLLAMLGQCESPWNDEMLRNIRKFVAAMQDCQGKTIYLDKFEVFITERMS